MCWFQQLSLDWTADSDARKAEALLLETYDANADVLRLAKNAGLNVTSLDQGARLKFLVRELLEAARNADRLLQLFVEVYKDDERTKIHEELGKLFVGYEAELSAAAMKAMPSVATLALLPPSLHVWANDAEQPAALANPSAFEKLINASTGFSDASVFRTRLAEAEVRTARIEVGGGPQGTGFLVGEKLLLTNWHVVKTVREGGAIARFDYRVAPSGAMIDEGRAVPFATAWDVAHSEHAAHSSEVGADGPLPGSWDYALVGLAEPVGAQRFAQGEVRGRYLLDGGCYDYNRNEALLIVGHPRARPLQLSYAAPSMVRVTTHGSRVRYQTNTEPGSSGSPVFNKDWRVVALHHASGVSPVPSELNVETRGFNQGIPMERVVASLMTELAGRPELAALGLQ